ncbi:hypothetical protein FB45DRAFT_524366 [Roridomyces roridus]|uniref:Uncharacterized protein n=1 Tax=Roridomyces roridus TaxID=1738132 RepID=A0AAD7BXZ3_9AGAR|nr:hypothetical protein FB45DRAFT_524366 [Roridomyces roridus]
MVHGRLAMAVTIASSSHQRFRLGWSHPRYELKACDRRIAKGPRYDVTAARAASTSFWEVPSSLQGMTLQPGRRSTGARMSFSDTLLPGTAYITEDPPRPSPSANRDLGWSNLYTTDDAPTTREDDASPTVATKVSPLRAHLGRRSLATFPVSPCLSQGHHPRLSGTAGNIPISLRPATSGALLVAIDGEGIEPDTRGDPFGVLAGRKVSVAYLGPSCPPPTETARIHSVVTALLHLPVVSSISEHGTVWAIPPRLVLVVCYTRTGAVCVSRIPHAAYVGAWAVAARPP